MGNLKLKAANENTAAISAVNTGMSFRALYQVTLTLMLYAKKGIFGEPRVQSRRPNLLLDDEFNNNITVTP